jgi:uncharacterized protein YhjY with autotransporter beta-barrel domain
VLVALAWIAAALTANVATPGIAAAAAPVISSVSPNGGGTGGGTSIQVGGSHFTGAKSVTVGGMSAAFSVNSDSQIRVTSPARATPGTVDIQITTSGGTSVVNANDRFTYGPPALTSVTPSSGTTAGGTAITLTGSNFTSATAVSFSGGLDVPFTVVSDTQITATTPSFEPVTTILQVIGPDGASNQIGFTFTGPPQITSVSPSAGQLSGGQGVQIAGNGLASVTSVKFGSTPATISQQNDQFIQVVSPPGTAAGTVDITATNSFGASATTTADQFTYFGAPTVTALSPTSGPTTGGTTLTITGTNFVSPMFAFCTSTGGVQGTVVSPTQMTAVSPAAPQHLPQSVDVIVCGNNGNSTATAADKFTYAAAQPQVSIPNSAPEGPAGTQVDVVGSGFTGATSVKFGAVAAPTFTIIDDNNILAISPPGGGAVDITVTGPGGTSPVNAFDKYVYSTGQPPTITGVSPASGSDIGGGIVVLTGANLQNVQQVLFGSGPATTFQSVSDTEIEVITPPASKGVIDIKVVTGDGASALTAADHFTYTDGASITAIDPTGGPTKGGNSVVILGGGFSSATAVYFGGVLATPSFLNSPSQITSTVPNHAAGVVDIQIATADGSMSPVSTADKYTYTNGPAIVSISPFFGAPSGGTSVVITGTDFSGVTAVRFGSKLASGFTVNSVTQITATAPAGSGSVDVTIIGSGGTSPTGPADIFIYAPPPVISDVAPSSGPPGGGDTVVISGSNLSTTAGVKFGTTSATSFTVINDNQVNAVSPAGSGTVDVSVTAAGGTSTTASTDHYTYAPAPTITGVSPNSGIILGGTSVTLSGSNFAAITGVSFGGVPATNFQMVSSTQVKATAPLAAHPGGVDVTVTGTGGTSAVNSADRFTYYEPSITGVSPNTGPENVALTVTVTGLGFTSINQLTFGGTVITPTVVSDTQLTATLPPQNAGVFDITVSGPSDGSAITPADQVTFFKIVPTVSAVSPNSGPTGGGTFVTITGTNFANGDSVGFGQFGSPQVTIISPTQIQAKAPPGSGTVDITVVTRDSASATSAADHFTYTGGPSVSNVSPGSGPLAGGSVVNISGAGFTGATAVKFGTVSATSFTINADNQITATSPAGSGTVDVTVTGSGGTSLTSVADQFLYEGPATVSGITPNSGTASGGTLVTVTGTGFTGVFGVKFGTTPGNSVTFVSDTQITVVSPAGSGTADITVITPSGVSAAVAADKFTYLGASPVVSAIAPTSGSTAGGTVVVVTGTGFTGATAVKFGTVAAATFTVNNDDQVTATAPAGAAGAVDITVTTPSGTSPTGTVDRFTYATPIVPAVTGLSPTTGPTPGGTSVVVTGSGFTGATAVKFGATAATAFTVNSDSQITATSPAGAAGAVDVTVTNSLGVSTAVAADKFTYSAAPAVTGINPNTGPAPGATVVTVTGVNFTGATAVKFGAAAAAAFTVNSATQITATAPAGSGAVDITITNPSGVSTTTAADVFTYGPSTTPAVTQVSPNSGSALGGIVVTISGTNFTGATAVKFGTAAAANFTVNSATIIVATVPTGVAGIVDVTVTTPQGVSPANAADTFTYTAPTPPIVTGIGPPNGVATGGTTVTISGSGLTGATGVAFGAVAASSFTIVSDNVLRAISPSASAGAVDIVVTTPVGVSAKSSVDLFTYFSTSPPTVTAISPNSGFNSGGTKIVITGTNFVDASAVTVVGVEVSAFSIDSSTQITAVANFSTNGNVTGDVRVQTPSGLSATSSADTFTYTTPQLATVTSVTPNSGPTAGGTSTVIHGSNLNYVNQLNFGATAVTFTVVSASEIDATSPATSTPGPVDITVRDAAGTSATSSADVFTYAFAGAGPVITGVSPNSGPVTGNTAVTLTGTGFTGVNGFKFGTAQGSSIHSGATDTQIVVDSPDGLTPGVVDIVVSNPTGSSAVTTADHFTYLAVAPSIRQVTPSGGTPSGGTIVTIFGQAFTTATAVKFGATSATSFSILSDSAITAVAPAGTGTVDITITDSAGTSAVSAADQYTYGASAQPAVTSISPTTGPAAGGTSVVITGDSFTGTTVVHFGGVSAPSFTVNSETQITALSPAGSGAIDITVTNAAGTSTAGVSGDKFTYASAPPTVTGLSPTSGPTAGGASVTITGTNLTGASAVKFGATAATNVTVNSATSITATAPAGPAGSVDVTVTTSAGTSATGVADLYAYTAAAAPPTVTALSPTTGPTAGATSVTLTGTNFTGATAVKFGAAAAASFTVNSATQITAVSPTGSVGAVDVTVSTPAGVSATGAADQFTYAAAAPPTVTALSPTSGPTAGGTSVTITGTGLTGATAVKFGAVAATAFTVNSDTQVTATSPAGPAGAVDVTVTTSAGSSATGAADKFTYAASGVPVVSALTPAGGPPVGGTSVVIAGSGFTGATAVKFGTKAASAFTVNSDSQVTAVAPSGTAGVVDVTVTTSAGTSATGAADRFTYAAAPAVLSVSPTTGPAAGGTTVTLTGSGFTGVTAVTFGTAPATSFTVVNASRITAVSPAGAGVVDILVTGPGGPSGARAADHFTYTGSVPTPTITAINPTTGPTAGGTSVTLTGTNFTGIVAVKFGATAAASFTVNSATSITATSPSGSAGAVDVTVTTSTATSATGAADKFTYAAAAPPPTITGINPSSGTATGGTSVTLSGTNFTGATGVTFGTTASTSFTVNSATSITAVSPGGLVGTIGLTVTTPGGTSAPTNAALFTYTTPPPIVTSISPKSGPTAGGTTVTITGSHFTGAVSVLFGNVEEDSFTINSDTSITTVSTGGTGTVDIVVVSNGGGSAKSQADQFTYVTNVPPPTVASISPTSGPASGGNSVTITGANFTNVTSVKFGTTAATFTVTDEAIITATSPVGSAGAVDVTVTTSSGTSATSAADQFTYTAASSAPTVTGVSPNSGYVAGQTSVTIAGTNFTNVQSVRFGSAQATSVTVNSANSITVVSPAAQGLGTVDVTVATLAGTSTTSAADQFTYTTTPPVPTVTGVSPNQGTSAGGTSVTITGTGFSPDSVPFFGTFRQPNFSVISVNEIFLVTGIQSAGTVDVTVTNSTGVSPTTAADKFTVAQGPPAIASLSPITGPAAGGTTVTLTGSGFTGASGVKFGTTAATSFTVNSDTQVTAVSPPGSGSVNVSVTTPNGTSGTDGLEQSTFVYGAGPPAISQVSPSSGPVAGSPTVNIVGVGFTGTTSVKFGSVTAGFQIVGDTGLIVNAPAQAAGTVDVVVTTPQGVSPTVAADRYTYVVLPAITSVSPSQGDPAGGTTVVLTGSTFTGATAVTFGPSPAASFTVNSDSQITAVTPPGSGTTGVTVTTPAGTSTSNALFVYTNAPGVPTISSISSNSGSANGGATITITGTNFIGASSVTFVPTNGVISENAPSLSVNSDTSITIVTPFSVPGAYNIHVNNITGQSASTAADVYTFNAPTSLPTVTSVSPNTGPVNGDTFVTITGTGFVLGQSTVHFGSSPNGQQQTVVSPTTMTVLSPGNSAATQDVTVTTPAGTSATSSADKFTWVAEATPSITSVSPSGGPTSGNIRVTISGVGFNSTTAVKFGASAATSFQAVSDNQITAFAPAGVAGVVDITVTTGLGVSPAVAADRFTYGAPTPPPAITNVAPNTGFVAGGTLVNIQGSGFTGVTSVKFGSVPGTDVELGSDGNLSVVSPAEAAGAVDITITTAAGASPVVATDKFTFVALGAAPSVSGISPSTGSTLGGATVVVTGSNFTGATNVLFGSLAATSFSIQSDTQITAIAPVEAAGVVDVTVQSKGGFSATGAADRFTFAASTQAPTITAISPNGGPLAGGIQVVITGTHFTGATGVKFGAVAATGVTVNSDTQITATSPAGSAGTVDMTVTTPNGTSATSTADHFTYAAAPTVTGVSPASGSIAGGTSVVITGTGFTTASEVMFAETFTSFTVNSDTQITAITPLRPAGTVDIVVANVAGFSAASNADHFTYVTPPTPVVTSISPTSGPVAGGTVLTINGSNFTAATFVKFGTAGGTALTVVSDSKITVTTPAGAGTVDVQVGNAGGTSAATAADQFTYAAAPTVTVVSPSTGPAAGGTSVVLTGTNFTGATAVSFGASPATAFTINSATQITATSPAGAAGAVDVTITTSGGTSVTGAADKFTYGLSGGAPVVTALSPTGGPPAGGTSVVITGSGFTGATAVKFGTKAATSFTVNSDAQMTAVTPTGTAGVVDVTVTTSAGTSVIGAADKFTYAQPPAVLVASPATGPAAGGTTVTLSGSGFTGATGVSFGTTPAASFTVVNASKITAVSPPGSGVVDIIVTGAGGPSAARASDHFTYTGGAPAPTVTGINPTTGPTTGGTSVTVTGSNFTGATGVKFGTASASFTVNSATSITATAPAGSAGSVNVTVATSAGTSATSAADQFTYTAAASPPTVASLSPTSGATAGGTSVTLTGTNFTGASAVKFGATAAASFTVNSATSITATSPAGSAGAVDVTVTTSVGTSATGAADQFTYAASASPPTVTALSPTTGPSAGGTTITLTGANFTGATAVKFGTVAATSFTVVSATSVTAVSPAGVAGAVDVTVTTPAGTSATGAADRFTYAAASSAAPTVTRIVPASGPAAGGTTVTVTGTNLTGATAVTFGGTAAATFTVNSATQITAVSPPGSGTVDVLVTTGGGTSAAKVADHFLYRAGGAILRTALRAHTSPGAPVAVDLTGGRPAGQASIVAISPATAGAAHITVGASPGTWGLSFTPRLGFTGQATVSYALAAGPHEEAAAGDVEITVDARPDPSADPTVRGVVDAQTEAALRFADAQISNFGQRLESLHDGGPARSHNGVNLGFGFGETQANPWVQRQVDMARLWGDDSAAGYGVRSTLDQLFGAAPGAGGAGQPTAADPAPVRAVRAAPGGGGGVDPLPSNLAVWTGGSISFGQRDSITGRTGFHFTSDGLSAGVDDRLTDWLSVGVGGGFGASTSKIGDDGTQVEARDYTGVIYGSFHPARGAFVDAMAGYGRLDFSERRLAGPGLMARGDRSGDDPFVSVTAGWDLTHDGFRFTPYGRIDSVSGRLDAFTESGAGAANLRFEDQSFSSLRGTLGAKGEWYVPTSYGTWTPRFRIEAHHEFSGADSADLNWATGGIGPNVSTTADPLAQDSFTLGLGADLKRGMGAFGIDYQFTADGVREAVHELRAKLEWKFW